MLEKLAAIFSIGQKKWRKQIAAIFLTLVLAVAGSFFTLNQPASALPSTGPSSLPSTGPSSLPGTGPSSLPGTGPSSPDSEESSSTEGSTCNDELGAIGWFVCPTTGALAKAIDSIYGVIVGFLKVDPLTTDSSSSTYLVWEYAKSITNIVFILLILIVIISQVTGLGITNYGLKKALPRIIIGAVMVNLSFILCTILVDVSNILGFSIHNFFNSIASSIGGADLGGLSSLNWDTVISAIIAGGAITGVTAVTITGGIGALIWAVLPAVVGGIIALFAAFVTLAARQALITLLVMISPLAIVAYLLPNTESLFKKWRDLLTKMLVFFPMFSLLFGASALAGWAIIAASGGNGITLILGMAVQIFPLIFTPTLLKMSGTILGKINEAIRRPFAPAQAALTNWSREHQAYSKSKHLAANKAPSARLNNYLAYRKQLRETDRETAETIISSRAVQRTQYKISAGFDANDPDKQLRANRYTRRAKISSTDSSIADTAKSDTKNLLGEYKSSYMSHYGKTDSHLKRLDESLDKAGGEAYLHANRTAFTAESNEDSDWNKLFKTFSEAALGAPEDNNGYGSYNYNKWLKASAGALGEKGISSVLGQIIYKADKAETRRKAYDHILLNKYGFAKREHRNFFVGYYNDDDGFATDKAGNLITFYDPVTKTVRPEMMPGELLKNDPSKLVLWDTVDEVSGKPYYNWTDQKGNFLMRVYKDDVPLMKEILTNYDTPINDPINTLYSILAGVDPDPNDPRSIGLSNFSTTIGRALQAANYKEKNSGMGAQAIATIMNRRIQNYSHLAIEWLDNIIKTGKASNFNTMDAIQVELLTNILDPRNKDIFFSEANIMDRVNVNGEPLEGLDENGNSVPADQATYEQKMRKIQKKYLNEAAKKFTSLATRVTFNTIDNQKPGAGDKYVALLEMLEKFWNGKDAVEEGRVDAFEQNSDYFKKASEVKKMLRTKSQSLPMDQGSSNTTAHNNPLELDLLIDELFFCGNPPEAIVETLRVILGDDPRFGHALEELDYFLDAHPVVEENDLYEIVTTLIQKYRND